MIVKLKPSTSGDVLPASLQQLNQQFGVKTTRPLLGSEVVGLRRRARTIITRWDSISNQTSQTIVEGTDSVPAEPTSRDVSTSIPSEVSDDPTGLDRLYLFEAAEKADVKALTQIYQANPYVEYAEPNYLVTAVRVPNDPYYFSRGAWGQTYDDLWGLKKLQVEQAWDVTEGEGIVVAVIDTGVDYTHEDLTEDVNGNGLLDAGEDTNANGRLDANVWINSGEDLNTNGLVDASDFDGKDTDGNGYVDDLRGWDFSTCVKRDRGNCPQSKQPDNNPTDGDGHGTHIAGTIAALGNNRKGIIGIAPKAKIMAVKAMDDGGSGTVDEFVAAIHYAANYGARVLSNSWTVHGSSQAIKDAIAYASAAPAQGGVSRKVASVVVVAAGNKYGQDAAKESPADAPQAIVVAASTPDDVRANFSNAGAVIDVVAPGVDILSLRGKGTDTYGDGKHFVGEQYYRADGTSMAAPHVAGVTALLLAHRPGLALPDLRQILRTSADEVPALWLTVRPGVGRLNAAKALALDPAELVRVDITAPAYGIKVPEKTPIQIRGTATGTAFASYQLSYAPASQSPSWNPIGSSVTTRVEEGSLGIWDPGTLQGDVLLRLVAVNTKGRVFQHLTPLTITFVEFPPRQITSHRTIQNSPRIDGDYLIWTDARHGGWDIYFYDLKQPERGEQRLTAQSQPYVLYPAVSQGRVAWAGFRNNQWSLYLYDLNRPDRGEQGLTLISPAKPVAMDGDFIVWMEGSAISFYDLSHPERGVQQPIKNLSVPIGFFPGHLAISGHLLVWLANDQHLYVGDLDNPSATPRRITTVSGVPAGGLGFEDGRIVWSSQGDIHLYDLNQPERGEQPITEHPSKQTHPVLSGNLIVWADERNETLVDSGKTAQNVDLYFYNLSRPELGVRQLTSDTANQTNPAISGNRVVCVDTRNGNEDIYLYEFPNRPPVLQPIAPQSVFESRLLSFTLQATDPDGDPLTYAVEPATLPPGATLHGQVFRWPTDLAVVAGYAHTSRIVPVTFSVSDGADTVSQIVPIEVYNMDIDVNGDGRVSVLDWVLTGRAAAGLITDPAILARADYNRSGSVTIVDWVWSGIIVGLLNDSPIATASGPKSYSANLRAAWRFEGNAQDSSGHGNHGTVNGVTAVAGKMGQGYAFTRASRGITIPGSASLALGGGDMTVAAWVYPRTIGNYQTVYDNPGRHYAFWLYNSGGGQGKGYVEFGGTQGGGWIDITPAFTAGAWQHLVVMRQGRTVKVYRNGMLAGTRALGQPGRNLPPGTALSLGANPSGGGTPWDGMLDEVHLYDRALTDAEIRQLMVGREPGGTHP
ncbi:MAG: S8 family serine peptidase [Candidatus Omnitrophica bacterium]|nr:S8 family serine peptidase [Candidatus Omnitrophota bacterium]